MKEKAFDNKVRDLMEAHTELPDVALWNSIENSLVVRRNRKLLFFRRAYTAAAAVAAALLLFLVLDNNMGDGPVISYKKGYDPIAELRYDYDIDTPEPALYSIANINDILYSRRKTSLAGVDAGASPGSTPSSQIASVSFAKDVLPEYVDSRESGVAKPEIFVKQDFTEKQDESQSYLQSYPYVSEQRTKVRRSPAVGVSTNLSPSLSGNSVSLMTMSQIQGGFASSDVVSTVQKANVPRETITNTKFLMPLTFGVQFQLPIGERLAAGAGVNYSLLFSHYDAISREEARETQQTLHYIGFPVGLYYTVLQKDNMRFYLNAGAMMEKGLYAWYVISENGVRDTYGRSIDGVQWSVVGGAGVEMAVNNVAGLYFDPSFAYFFNNDQPLNIRTSQPLQFKFELGLRFHL